MLAAVLGVFLQLGCVTVMQRPWSSRDDCNLSHLVVVVVSLSTSPGQVAALVEPQHGPRDGPS